ncbi:MAG: transposase [Phycisphaerae bacterium]|jgi:transposase
MSSQLLPDEVWSLIEPRLPARRERPKGGRPALSDRQVLAGIVFVLKTGIAWVDLPAELGCGCGMTCLRRLRDWQIAGVWPQIQNILVANLKHGDRINWSRVNHGSPYVPIEMRGAHAPQHDLGRMTRSQRAANPESAEHSTPL